MKMFKRLLLPLLALLFTMCAVNESGQDWPQWRGLNRDGISHETGFLSEWPAGGPKLVWQVKDLGEGYSTPIVVGSRLYVQTNDTLNNEYLKELDTQSGKTTWSTRIGAVGKPDQRPSFPGTRSTPTVDGAFIYALSSDGDIVCLEKASGKIIWQKNIIAVFKGVSGVWAYSESPLIDGDKVLVTPGGPEASIVALNKTTGDLIWKAAIPGCKTAGYASLVIAEGNGVKQYIASVDTGLVGIDADGSFSWLKGEIRGNGTLGTPVTKNEYVYAASRNASGVMKLTKSAEGTKTEQLYLDTKFPAEIGGSVLVGDYLYGTKGKHLLCVDFMTGEIKWKEKNFAPASLCAADGKLFVHGYDGQIAMIEATPESYKELAHFSPSDQPSHTKVMESIWTYPIVAYGKLYIRDLNSLWCYQIR